LKKYCKFSDNLFYISLRIKKLCRFIKYFIKSTIRNIITPLFRLIYQLESDEWGLVCPYGIGDTYFTCGFASEILKTHGGKKITVFLKQNHSFIPNIFPVISKTVVVKFPFNVKYLGTNNLKPGTPFYSHFTDNDTFDLIGYNNMTLIDCYKKILKLNEHSCLSNPLYPTENEFRKAEEVFFKNKLLKLKTVILAPEANSTSVVNKNFWIDLSKELNNNGFIPVGNIIIPENNIQGIRNLNLPLALIRAFAELSGFVVSVRNGLCDLLSNVNASLVVIYPDIIWYGGKLIDGTSLKSMKISKSVIEYEFKKNNSNKIIDDIVSAFKQKSNNSQSKYI